MITKINPNVYKVERLDLSGNQLAETFDYILDSAFQDDMGDLSYMVVQSRNDTHINGSVELIEGIEIDYRKERFIILKPNGNG